MNNMFGFLNDMDNYEDRKISNELVNGIEVSTVYTSDEGYETALIDKNGVHPVERYGSKKEAIEGHEKWKEAALTIKTIKKLGGFGGLVEDKEVELKRAYNTN